MISIIDKHATAFTQNILTLFIQIRAASFEHDQLRFLVIDKLSTISITEISPSLFVLKVIGSCLLMKPSSRNDCRKYFRDDSWRFLGN